MLMLLSHMCELRQQLGIDAGTIGTKHVTRRALLFACGHPRDPAQPLTRHHTRLLWEMVGASFDCTTCTVSLTVHTTVAAGGRRRITDLVFSFATAVQSACAFSLEINHSHHRSQSCLQGGGGSARSVLRLGLLTLRTRRHGAERRANHQNEPQRSATAVAEDSRNARE